ncbi:MAG: hypothetical protein V4641_16710 [Pseudomonadota bacterium]
MNEIKFSDLEAFCDDPALPSEVNAILAPITNKGFSLSVTIGTHVRRVVSSGTKPHYFRTIEAALSGLIDVPNLSRKVIVDLSGVAPDTL